MEHRRTASPAFHAQRVITPDQAALPCYRRAIEDELAATAALDDGQLADLRINHPDILAYRSRVLGNGAAGAGYAGWTDFLLDTYGPRRSCLSLGSGMGRVESHLLARGFAPSFEAVELSPLANQNAAVRDDRIAALSGDLNFAKLPERRYDFILCHGILHHLINLEHVLHQIDRALTPEGVLLVYEYVGEDRWQFGEDRMETLRRLVPGVSVRVPRRHQVRGFESVRSSELPHLLRHQFGDTCERAADYGGVYFPFVVGAPEPAMARIGEVLAADERAARERLVRPCYHMGVYRKSGAAPLPARAWSDDELRARLAPPTPVTRRALDELRRSPAGPTLRRVRRAVRGMVRTIQDDRGSEVAA
ncbi:MAG: class I SAM-dependent methyltransferase [Phycisphaerales bacterium]